MNIGQFYTIYHMKNLFNHLLYIHWPLRVESFQSMISIAIWTNIPTIKSQTGNISWALAGLEIFKKSVAISYQMLHAEFIEVLFKILLFLYFILSKIKTKLMHYTIRFLTNFRILMIIFCLFIYRWNINVLTEPHNQLLYLILDAGSWTSVSSIF